MLTGGPGANLLDASRFDGPVTLDGAAGNDTLIAGHGGSWLTGGPGSDSMAGGARADVVAELRDANFTLTNSALQISGDGDDTLSNIEGADLRGGAGANRFDASAFTSGAATVHGNGGHDTLIGSPGGDKLRGGDGNDVVSGGDGDDSLGGGPGNDSLAGGAGLDRIEEWGNVNFTLANTLLTGNGADTLAGVERAFLTGGDGNNLLNASAFTAGGVMLNGREGNDTLIGSPGSDSLYGNGDNDSLIGGGGNDSLIAGDLGLISVNAGGVESANNDTPHLGVSANGRYVFFASDATDLVTGLSDTNGSQDIFARDLLTHATTLISINATGAGTGNGGVFDADVSDDGRYVVFISTATDLVTGFTDVANTRDVFLRDMQTGTTTLVSKNVAGTAAGNGDAGEVVITPDGRYVVFESTAGDLVAEDTNGALRDVFRWDRVTDTLTLVSVNVSGTDSGNDESFEASITPDGRYVVFSSWATDLAPGVSDSNLANDVFRRDTQTGTTTLISVHTGGTGAGNAASDEATISDDGRYVLFKSWATDLQSAVPDNNSNADIFMRDVQDGTTALVSVNAEGTAAGNGYTGDGEISPDGRYAVFESEASDLVAGVADNNGQDDVFIRDLQTGTTQMISGNSDGTAAGNGESEEFEFTPDGRFVIFASGADDLVSGGTDTNDSWDVFLRDVQSGTTRLLSIGFLGAAPNNHSGEPSISDDGRVVAFASFATDMLPRAGDGEANVFVRDFSTAERLNGGDGNDVLLGGGGPDSLVGGRGNDQLRAGAGNDLLNGEDGDDTLDGAAGNDRLHGGFGSDYLFGGLGDDLLVGEPQSARPSSRVRDVVIDWAGVNSWVLKPGLKTIITSQNDPRLITIMPAYFPWILFP